MIRKLATTGITVCATIHAPTHYVFSQVHQLLTPVSCLFSLRSVGAGRAGTLSQCQASACLHECSVWRHALGLLLPN